ncbi:head GIN domain-containing protein [Lutibacter sp.]
MKKLAYISCFILLISCNKENVSNCLQTAGKIVQQEITVDTFDKILVNKRVELIITDGPVQKVVIETGKNLLPDVEVKVVNKQLILTNNNTCNFFRDYGLTKIHVTSPNINTIRNASEQRVISNGTLTYPSLYLRSSGEKKEFLATGDWHLTIENEKVIIWANGVANFYINGSSNNLDIGFTDGDTRFEGKNFIVQNIDVKNVSSNDIIIFPVESLTGSIHSVGDVISYNRPPIVDVEILSEGELIFK